MPEVRLEKLVAAYGLARQQTEQLLEDGYDAEFEALATEFGDPQVVASALTYQYTEIRREGLDVDGIPLDRLRDMFRLLRDGGFAKEAVPRLLRHMAREGSEAAEAVAALGLGSLSDGEVDAVLDEVVAAHEAMVRERGEKALGPLMGVAMERLRGKADGRLVNERLRARIVAKRP